MHYAKPAPFSALSAVLNIFLIAVIELVNKFRITVFGFAAPSLQQSNLLDISIFNDSLNEINNIFCYWPNGIMHIIIMVEWQFYTPKAT